jgi:hypothetical protein
MSLERLVSKYIASAEHALRSMEVIEQRKDFPADRVKAVVESATAYLEDAKHFRNESRFEVSLTSVAYCEGLLDALRLLEAVKFEWLPRTEVQRKE